MGAGSEYRIGTASLWVNIRKNKCRYLDFPINRPASLFKTTSKTACKVQLWILKSSLKRAIHVTRYAPDVWTQPHPGSYYCLWWIDRPWCGHKRDTRGA